MRQHFYNLDGMTTADNFLGKTFVELKYLNSEGLFLLHINV